MVSGSEPDGCRRRNRDQKRQSHTVALMIPFGVVIRIGKEYTQTELVHGAPVYAAATEDGVRSCKQYSFDVSTDSARVTWWAW
jgi:hypothetical protein